MTATIIDFSPRRTGQLIRVGDRVRRGQNGPEGCVIDIWGARGARDEPRALVQFCGGRQVIKLSDLQPAPSVSWEFTPHGVA